MVSTGLNPSPYGSLWKLTNPSFWKTNFDAIEFGREWVLLFVIMKEMWWVLPLS